MRLRYFVELEGENLRSPPMGILRTEEHKILLEILKKVESKNAVILAVTAFVLSIFMQLLLRDFARISCGFGGWFLTICIGLVAGTVVARADGAADIDQIVFEKILNDTTTRMAFKRRGLQVKLMRNLVLKEARFRASFYVFALVAIFLVLFMLSFDETTCAIIHTVLPFGP